MSTADERIAVFQDTMDWIESDPDLRDKPSIHASLVDNTGTIYPMSLFTIC